MSLDIRNNKFWREAHSVGTAEGKAQLLRQQLIVRFGELPAWVQERLASMNDAALDQLGIRLITAQSLEEAFVIPKTN